VRPLTDERGTGTIEHCLVIAGDAVEDHGQQGVVVGPGEGCSAAGCFLIDSCVRGWLGCAGRLACRCCTGAVLYLFARHLAGDLPGHPRAMAQFGAVCDEVLAATCRCSQAVFVTPNPRETCPNLVRTVMLRHRIPTS